MEHMLKSQNLLNHNIMYSLTNKAKNSGYGSQYTVHCTFWCNISSLNRLIHFTCWKQINIYVHVSLMNHALQNVFPLYSVYCRHSINRVAPSL